MMYLINIMLLISMMMGFIMLSNTECNMYNFSEEYNDDYRLCVATLSFLKNYAYLHTSKEFNDIMSNFPPVFIEMTKLLKNNTARNLCDIAYTNITHIS
jgi:hypothetical protein